jgi:hypothetical protein
LFRQLIVIPYNSLILFATGSQPTLLKQPHGD